MHSAVQTLHLRRQFTFLLRVVTDFTWEDYNFERWKYRF